MRCNIRMRSERGNRVLDFPINEVEQSAALFVSELVTLGRHL
jgi:hypothetical protein